MSHRPKHGKPRKNQDHKRQDRRRSALERRKSDLARYRAGHFPLAENGSPLTPEGQKQKIAAAVRDIAGLEANLLKGPQS